MLHAQVCTRALPFLTSHFQFTCSTHMPFAEPVVRGQLLLLMLSKQCERSEGFMLRYTVQCTHDRNHCTEIRVTCTSLESLCPADAIVAAVVNIKLIIKILRLKMRTSSSAVAETRAAGWVSFGQKWKMIFCRHFRSIFDHCDVIGHQSCHIR